MSGGSFNYAYNKVQDFCDELQQRLDENEEGFDVETQCDLADICTHAHFLAEIMKEVEWLYSGDTSEETFNERIEEILDRMEMKD